MNLSIFENFPASLIEAHGDWLPQITEKCPLLSIAIDHAVATDITVKYFPQKAFNGSIRNAGQAIFYRREIEIFYQEAETISNFCDILGHEIKHQSQHDECQAYLDWRKFQTDLSQSLKQEYCMARSYRLPTIDDAILVCGFAEIDAYVFGDMTKQEGMNAFESDKGECGSLSQADVDEKYKEFLEANNIIIYSMMREASLLKRTAQCLIELQQKYGVSPSIEWISVTPAGLRAMMGSLWKKSAYFLPFVDSDVQKLAVCTSAMSISRIAAQAKITMRSAIGSSFPMISGDDALELN